MSRLSVPILTEYFLRLDNIGQNAEFSFENRYSYITSAHFGHMVYMTSRGGRMSRAPTSRFEQIVESEDPGFEYRAHRFEAWSSQTKDFKIDTCRFLAWRLGLLG